MFELYDSCVLCISARAFCVVCMFELYVGLLCISAGSSSVVCIFQLYVGFVLCMFAGSFSVMRMCTCM